MFCKHASHFFVVVEAKGRGKKVRTLKNTFNFFLLFVTATTE